MNALQDFAVQASAGLLVFKMPSPQIKQASDEVWTGQMGMHGLRGVSFAQHMASSFEIAALAAAEGAWAVRHT